MSPKSTTEGRGGKIAESGMQHLGCYFSVGHKKDRRLGELILSLPLEPVCPSVTRWRWEGRGGRHREVVRTT